MTSQVWNMITSPTNSETGRLVRTMIIFIMIFCGERVGQKQCKLENYLIYMLWHLSDFMFYILSVIFLLNKATFPGAKT